MTTMTIEEFTAEIHNPHNAAIFEIYQTAVARITNRTGEPLGMESLPALRIGKWADATPTGLLKRLVNALFPRAKIHAEKQSFDISPLIEEGTYDKYLHFLEASVAQAKSGEYFEYGKSTIKREQKVADAFEQESKQIKSRYYLILECCTRLAAFALSDQSVANPISVIESIEYFIQKVLAQDILMSSSCTMRMRGRSKSDEAKVRLDFIAANRHQALLDDMKAALHFQVLLKMPHTIFTTDIQKLDNARVRIEQLLILCLQRHVGERPKRAELRRGRRHRKLQDLQERIQSNGSALEIVREIAKRNHSLAETVQSLYQTYAKLADQKKIARRFLCIVHHANWLAFLDGAINIRTYTHDLSLVWDQVRTHLQFDDQSPLAHSSILDMAHEVIRGWHVPSIAAWDPIMAAAVSPEDGVSRHHTLALPAVKARMRTYLKEHMTDLLAFAVEQPGFCHAPACRRIEALLGESDAAVLDPAESNQITYTPEQLMLVLRAILREHPDTRFLLLLGQAKDPQIAQNYVDLQFQYPIRSVQLDMLKLHQEALAKFLGTDVALAKGESVETRLAGYFAVAMMKCALPATDPRFLLLERYQKDMRDWYTALFQLEQASTLATAQAVCEPCYQALLRVSVAAQTDFDTLYGSAGRHWKQLEQLHQQQVANECIQMIADDMAQDQGPLRRICESYGIRFYAPQIERQLAAEGKCTTLAHVSDQLLSVLTAQDDKGNTLLHHILMEYDGGVHGMPAEKLPYCEVLYGISDSSIRNHQAQIAIEYVRPRLETHLDTKALDRMCAWKKRGVLGRSVDALYDVRLTMGTRRRAEYATVLASTARDMQGLWVYASPQKEDPHAQECLQAITRWQMERVLGVDQGFDDLSTILDQLPSENPLESLRDTLRKRISNLLPVFEQPGATGDVKMKDVRDMTPAERDQRWREAAARVRAEEERKRNWERAEVERQRADEALRKREADLGSREADLGSREADLGSREADLAARQAEFDQLLAQARAAQGFSYTEAATAVPVPEAVAVEEPTPAQPKWACAVS